MYTYTAYLYLDKKLKLTTGELAKCRIILFQRWNKQPETLQSIAYSYFNILQTLISSANIYFNILQTFIEISICNILQAL